MIVCFAVFLLIWLYVIIDMTINPTEDRVPPLHHRIYFVAFPVVTFVAYIIERQT